MKSHHLNRVETILGCLGIDVESFATFLDWSLSEQLVAVMAEEISEKEFFSQKDALKQFRDRLHTKTGRKWSASDLNLLFDAVKASGQPHFRKKIEYGDLLKILWNLPHCCAECGARPPLVKLHIDHIYPASLGGSSKAHNLQFLCEKHNLQKSNKLKKGTPWPSLQ